MTDDPAVIDDRELQDALKNGYLQGYWQAVHDLEAKKTTKELRAHVESTLTALAGGQRDALQRRSCGSFLTGVRP